MNGFLVNIKKIPAEFKEFRQFLTNKSLRDLLNAGKCLRNANIILQIGGQPCRLSPSAYL